MSKFLPSPPRLRVRSLAALVRGIWGGHPFKASRPLIVHAGTAQARVHSPSNHFAWLDVSLFLQQQRGRK